MKKSLIKITGVSLEKLEGLQKKYKEKTGRHITFIEIVSRIINKAKIEDLG